MIGFLVLSVISYASLTEGLEEYGQHHIRLRRATKDSEKKTEKSNKKDAANGRSQLAGPGGSNTELPGDESENGEQIPNRISGKFLGLPASGGVYPINNSPFMPPAMAPAMPNYAATFPYQGMPYPPPQQIQQNFAGGPPLPPANQLGGYFYGNPSLQAIGVNPVIQNGNNFIRPPQAPLPPSGPSGPYANNFMNYGNFPVEQQGLPVLPNGQGIPVSPLGGPQYSVHNVQTAPSSLQYQAFAQRQPDFMNPFAAGFPYTGPQQDRISPDFGIPFGYYTGYPRFQRSLKLKKE